MSRRFSSLVDPFAAPDAAPDPDVWRFLLQSARPLRRVIAMSLVLAVIGAGIEVWLIFYTGTLVDVLAATRPVELWSRHGGELLLAAAIVLIGRPLAGYLRESLDDIAFRPNAVTMAQWRAHRHVVRQSVGWFRANQSGLVAAQVSEVGASATSAIYQVVHTLAYVVIYVAGSVVLMASIDLRLIWPLVLWVACYLGLVAYIVPRVRNAAEEMQEAEAALGGMMVDSYANIEVIKLFADSREEDREARNRFSALRNGAVKFLSFEVTINSSMLFLGSLLIVALVGYTMVLWQAGGAPIGLVAAALALSFRITGMAEWMLDAVAALFSSLGQLRQSLRTVAQPLAVTDAPAAPALRVSRGAITFSAVSHHYARQSGGLDGVTLAIAGGEKVGLVGRSGVGKSTLVNLLLRFFDAETGRIAIDGQDVAAVSQESLRRSIAMVAQQAALLHRSVRENIAYGRTDVGEAAIVAAARQVEADGFIAGLRDHAGRTGYDAHVGERGVTLSGGQRQRIALARAILKDAPILILDEATSALDSEVEATILDTLYGLMEGKTVIAIAHRLSTIARMDRIVVLDAGRIVEDGTHGELLARGGIYAALWARQSGGYIGARPD
jgi:ATP-binding cassette subfamily B multidrug efflux pump